MTAAELRPGAELGGEGHPVGRDPRRMSQAELRAMGHEAMPVLTAMRARCLDCAGAADEVRKCMALRCAAWPFRMGTNPWRAPASDAQREAARERGKKLAAARNNSPVGAKSPAADVSHPEAGR